MIPQLGADPTSPFPDAESALARPDGLLAWGGDLDPIRLLSAYRQGIFPWYTAGQPILWWSPSRRCVIVPSEVHVSRRLGRILRQGKFVITADRAFAEVVAGCALPRPGQDSTWITAEMMRAYEQLHRLGYGHAIEVWSGGDLVGGIYGLSLGHMFFGESMFSRSPDASKVALVALCRQLQKWQFSMLDCQICSPHLKRMGAVEISREAFRQQLAGNTARSDLRGSWRQYFADTPELSSPTARIRG